MAAIDSDKLNKLLYGYEEGLAKPKLPDERQSRVNVEHETEKQVQ